MKGLIFYILANLVVSKISVAEVTTVEEPLTSESHQVSSSTHEKDGQTKITETGTLDIVPFDETKERLIFKWLREIDKEINWDAEYQEARIGDDLGR